MGILDIIYFRSDKYSEELKEDSEADLLHKYHGSIRKATGHIASVGFHTGIILASGGTSSAGIAFSVRQVIVLQQRLELVEKEFERRNLEVPRTRGRDLIGGFLTFGAYDYAAQLLRGDVEEILMSWPFQIYPMRHDSIPSKAYNLDVSIYSVYIFPNDKSQIASPDLIA